jgi:hypothetical protein
MMKIRKILDEVGGRARLKMEIFEGERAPHDYGISRMAWLRGAKLMKHHGPDKALELIDERAERAADRGDFETSRRWRSLITAIHAIEEDEPLAGDRVH